MSTVLIPPRFVNLCRGEPVQREQKIERVRALRGFATAVDEQMTALDTLKGNSK